MHCHLLAAAHIRNCSKKTSRSNFGPNSTLFARQRAQSSKSPITVNSDSTYLSQVDKGQSTEIAQHVSRIRLELAPPLLRQGLPPVVRIHTLNPWGWKEDRWIWGNSERSEIEDVGGRKPRTSAFKKG